MNDAQHKRMLTASGTHNHDQITSTASCQPSRIPLTLKTNPRSPFTVSVKYGPLIIKRRIIPALTLATGRQSQDYIVEGEAARKRERRRIRNRDSARNARRARNRIEQDLKTQVKELEAQEQCLDKQIESLQNYKSRLEERSDIFTPTYEIFTIKPSVQSINGDKTREEKPSDQPALDDCFIIKEEARPASPQWQLVFGIESL